MKLTALISVLALAGTLTACNTGPAVQGCTVDPSTGACVGSGGPNGTGGTPGTGGGPGCDPGDAEFTNACTCSSLGEENINCDYGCTALGVDFGFAAVLEVFPDPNLVGGGAFNVDFEGFFLVSESFIAGAEAVVGNVNTAVVGPNATLPVTALSGATGPDLIMTLEEGLELDLNADPNGNGIPGPFPLPFVAASETYTFGANGTEACFNLAAGIQFLLTITDPPIGLPALFNCEPANQELVNQTSVACPNGDSDCLAPSLCDNELEPFCLGVIEPEPTTGQVCFTIGGTGGTGGTGGSGGAGGSTM